MQTTLGAQVFTVIVTAIASATCAGLWAYLFWRRDKLLHLFEIYLTKKIEIIGIVSKILGQRIYDQHRVFWALEDICEPKDITEALLVRIESENEKYYDTLRIFNAEMLKIKAELHVIFGDAIAHKFYVSEKEAYSQNTKTIYGHFAQLHRNVKRLRNKARSKDSRFQVQSATPSPWVLASSKKTS